MGLTIALVVVVPRFARLFIEFDLPLPAPTVLLVNLSNLLVVRGIFLLPLLLMFDIALLLGLRAIPEIGPLLSTIWSGIALIAFAGLVGLVVIGLFLPLIALIQGLG
jgi:type II secretory pathway component PulF